MTPLFNGSRPLSLIDKKLVNIVIRIRWLDIWQIIQDMNVSEFAP